MDIASALSTWILDGGSLAADLASVIAGLLLIVLALPRGAVRHSYGSWDRFVF